MAVGASLLSLAFLVAPALAAAPTPRAPRPASPSPGTPLPLDASPTLPAARTTPGPTILFLIDNSASLPPLDPE